MYGRKTFDLKQSSLKQNNNFGFYFVTTFYSHFIYSFEHYFLGLIKNIQKNP